MKQKTRKTMEKRFKITSSGKLLRGHAYSSHLKSKKSKARIRRQKEPILLSDSFAKKIRKLVGGRR